VVTAAKLPHGFRCHSSLVHGLELVFGGLYEVDMEPHPDTVLDIGGNAGAFTMWALGRWPGARITTYEPSASTLRNLYENVKPETRNGLVTIVGKAVTSLPGPYAFLHDGRQNTGERSLYDMGDQLVTGESVAVEHPEDLSQADFLKLDCEGAELDILTHYPLLDKCRAVALEWHIPEQLPDIITTLAKAGLRICAQDRQERMLKFKHHTEL
jgi:FkbM family methyltransferase